MKKKYKSIYFTIIINYIAFVLVMIIIVLASLAFAAFLIQRGVEKGKLPLIRAEDVLKPDYENMNTKYIENLGGQVQILDENLKVIYTKGSNLDDRMGYSKEELFKGLSFETYSRYFYTMKPFTASDGRKLYCLVRIPGSKINVQLNFTNAPYSVNGMFIDASLKALIFFILLFLINIFFYSKWTTKKIAAPLKLIINGIKRMTGGDYGTKLEFDAEGEFREIRDAFNYMVDEVEKSQGEKKKIEASKQRMLVDISHDIKTPLTVVMGYAKAINQGMVEDDEKKKRYLKTIYEKSSKVVVLIDELFELSKLDSAGYSLSLAHCDFSEFIRETIAGHYEEIEDKGFDLDMRLPDSKVMVFIDKKEMSRAVSNIVTNAIKYNPPGTTLRIELFQGENEVLLEIADNGTGISDNVKSIIFDPFVRGDEARVSDGGTGLGLSIAKRIVEKHGGTIELVDGNTGEKTVFLIRLKINPQTGIL